jgi:uncharacterized membrane protein (UPF0127 family)
MLYNKTKKFQIIKKVKFAETIFSRFKGLMFLHKKNFDFALVFVLDNESRLSASIHMMFMRFPIDVLWLNARKRVVDKHNSLKPWALNATPKKAAAFIIELPIGKAERVSIGDLIEWKE